MRRRDFLIGGASLALLPLSARTWAAAPAEAFRPEGLAAVDKVVTDAIAAGDIPGAALLLAKGDAVYAKAFGTKTYGGGEPIRRDTIFRIASMTKPVIAAAVMMLVEDGKVRLDEPAERLLPELVNRRVLKRLDGPLDDTVPAERPILVRDLMNFTFGFGLEFNPDLPINKAIDALELVNGPPVPQTPHPPDEWMRRFGTLPLMHQPGETWQYNTGSLILGVLIARAGGMPLADFLDQRIFKPLGMVDTGFFVPPEKMARFQPAFWKDEQTGKQTVYDDVAGQWSAPPPFPSGAAGLVSTADDYLAFARMLLNNGATKVFDLQGGAFLRHEVLSEASVREMTRDQLTPAQKAGSGLGPDFFKVHGWGYGLRVLTAPNGIAKAPGQYGWNGGLGTSWANDPNLGLTAILLTQSVNYYISSNDFRDFWAAAYAAVRT
jgi:CubicO group peptidase (beta-lactamase class C family)